MLYKNMNKHVQYLILNFFNRHWLYNIARGIDSEPVTPRLVSKSIGACKRFPGKQAIVDVETVSFFNKLKQF